MKGLFGTAMESPKIVLYAMLIKQLLSIMREDQIVLTAICHLQQNQEPKGDKVKKGDVIATVEAMKMEQEIKSEISGEVKDIFVSEGDSVASGGLLMQIL